MMADCDKYEIYNLNNIRMATMTKDGGTKKFNAILTLPKFVLDSNPLSNYKMQRIDELIHEKDKNKNQKILRQKQQKEYERHHILGDQINNIDRSYMPGIQLEQSFHQKYIGKYFHKKRSSDPITDSKNSQKKRLLKKDSLSINELKNGLLKTIEDKTHFVKLTGHTNKQKNHNNLVVLVRKDTTLPQKKEMKTIQLMNRQKQQIMINELRRLNEKEHKNLNKSHSKYLYLNQNNVNNNSMKTLNILNKTILVQPKNFYNNSTSNTLIIPNKSKEEFKVDALRARFTQRNSCGPPRKYMKKYNKSQFCLETTYKNFGEGCIKSTEAASIYNRNARFNQIKVNSVHDLCDKTKIKRSQKIVKMLPQIRGWDIEEEYMK